MPHWLPVNRKELSKGQFFHTQSRRYTCLLSLRRYPAQCGRACWWHGPLRNRSLRGCCDNLGGVRTEPHIQDEARVADEVNALLCFPWWKTCFSSDGLACCLCRQSREELEHIDSEGRCVVTDHSHFVLFNVYGPAISNEENAAERFAFKLAFYRVSQPPDSSPKKTWGM